MKYSQSAYLPIFMSEKDRNVNSAMCSEDSFFVVGIGASAGGLNALEEFFEQMPIDSGAAFVVVQHLSPNFKSLMKELLERRTTMPIHPVAEGMRLQPNSVYLIPPGKNLILEDYNLHLLHQQRNLIHLNLPIDILFESLAKSCSNKAVGIVLSGTGSDGTKGLEAIDRVGGSTLVQDPATAEFDGMPRQAIATGIVEQILSPRKLALATYQLTRPNIFSNNHQVDSLELCKSPKLEQIVRIIAQNEQTDFSNYKTNTLSRRIYRRYLITGCANLDEFIELLQDSAEERSLLRQDLLIGVTQFFRDRPAWDCLKTKILPKLIAQTKEAELRCWVAACATGEEAYSLAILLDEAIANSQKQLRFKIFATDLDRTALAKATEGIYSEAIADHLSDEHLDKYFVRNGQSLQVVRRLKERILFAPHDLTKDVGFTRMSLVSCRNVLIYLQGQLQQQVLRNLHFSLAPKGILFLGEAENLAQLASEFTVLDRKGKIYRKKRDVRLFGTSKSLELPHSRRFERRERPQAKAHLEPMLEKAFGNFLNKYRATCFLVDREHQLFHTFNDGIKVLKIPLGKTTTDITKLVAADLQLPLITALHRAKAERSPISYQGIKVEQENSTRYLHLEVVYSDDRVTDDFFCITIQQEEAALQPVPERFNPDVEASQRILKLEHELQQTRENLQAVIEELEATNEEHQATNEELIASNEELQSANEELHSVNEELYTVNTEYQSKIEELTELNNDIDNLLRSTDIGVVFLDSELKIRKFTPAAMTAINLVETDINRPLEHITHNLDCQDLIELLKEAIANSQIVEREVKLVKNDFYLLMRVYPYLSEDGRSDGIVISFVDIHELKTIQQQINSVNQDLQKSQLQLRKLNQELETRVTERTAALKKSETRLRAILETTSSVIYLKDVRGHYLLANQQYLELLGMEESEVLGKCDRDLFPQDMADKFTANDRQVIASQSVLQFEELAVMKDHLLRTYISTKAPLVNEQGEVYAVCGISTNISQQKQTEAELRESAAREKTILKIVSKIRQTFDLDEIFQTVTVELKKTLKCDRLVLYRFNPDWSGEFVAESVDKGWTRLITEEMHIMWQDTCLQTSEGGRYKEHQTFVVDDVAQADFSDCHREIYNRIQAKAFCIAPVFQGDRLWGLLASYQNKSPRRWKEGEISLLTQTGIQLGISLDQIDLFTQIQNQTKQLKQAKEAAEAANHAKSVFIAHTSHELRTPLSAILGFARILQRQPDNNSAQSRAIEAIGQSGQHLLTLINDILHLAKIEAGKLTLEPRDFLLSSFLNNLIDIIRIRCQQKEIDFEYKVLSTLPKIVRGDETRLRQLLFNLLSNAIKFTDRGKVEFQVGYARDFAENSHAESSDKIRFLIKDTGCGIPQSEYQDIFLPFHQLDIHQTFQEGTGLGLTISRSLAEQMGSQIEIESTVNRGSTFWFDLDFSVVETVREIAVFENVESEITGYTDSVKRIAIVDDSERERQVLAELLAPLGFEIMEAKSGETAIALSRQNRPDLVFLSSTIIESEGSELIQRLKTELDPVPVIVLLDSDRTAAEFQGNRDDASGFLPKPIYFEQLLRTIEQHLNITWTTNDGTKQLCPSDGLSISSTIENVLLAILTTEQLTKLLELTSQGDIRGTISYATTLERERSQLKPFTQKIVQLAENCQLRKLKQLIQQYIDAK